MLYPELSGEKAREVLAFHRSLEGYEETPLESLDDFAQRNGVGKVYLKNESFRFGLNAFKALGGSYAVDRAVKAGYVSGEKEAVFITATDGNHGRGVAWAAKRLGRKAVVLMPAGSSSERLENIKKEGAEAYITSMNYDDTVREASRLARENGWVLVQDTAWDGYEEIPLFIMQGYLTMVSEALSAMPEKPTHVFVQAGVGSMASAVCAHMENMFPDGSVRCVIVEADKADCFYRTAAADDGTVHTVGGDLDTIMAGLACGEPSVTAWKILSKAAYAFVSMSDGEDTEGIRALRYPEGKDPVIYSGESGAAGFSALRAVLEKEELSSFRKELGLGRDSVILLFSTEGVTDRASYAKITEDPAFL